MEVITSCSHHHGAMAGGLREAQALAVLPDEGAQLRPCSGDTVTQLENLLVN